MKLKELLADRFGDNHIYPDHPYRRAELEPIKEQILNCDEFFECQSIDFIDFPTITTADGNVFTAQTIKLDNNMRFIEDAVIYSISLTPEVYDPNRILTPVKDGAAIGPTVYDPMDFTPKRQILLTWTPEMAQDLLAANTEENIRNDIHRLLDDVLDNPEEYKVKGDRGVMLRGMFKIRKLEDNNPPFLVGNTTEQGFYMAFYMEETLDQTTNELSLTLKSKPIPRHLKDEFIRRFTNNGGIAQATKEQIENFINEDRPEAL
jgi:hypothetical protein